MNTIHSIPFLPLPDAEWSVCQKRFSVTKNRHYESLFTLGSGHLNIRGSLPEGLTDDPQNVSFNRKAGNVTVEKFQESKSKWGTYIPGFMEAHPDLNEEMINLPFPLGIILEADGEKLDMEKSTIKKYVRWLDFRDACLRRRCEWHTQSGAILYVTFATFVHSQQKECLFQEVTVSVQKGNCTIEYGAFLDSDVRTNGFDHFTHSKTNAKSNGTADITVKTHAGQSAAVALQLSGAKKWRIKTAPRYTHLLASQKVKKGQALVLRKTAAIVTSLDASNPTRAARQCAAFHAKQDLAGMFSEHAECWSYRWHNMSIDIDGDAETAYALRLSEYHLTRANPQDKRAAICAKMNGGDAYWGRIHWDNEMYIVPFFIYTSPELARPLLEYRYTTLPGAQKRAQELGYPGAVYAWESGTDGTEQCPSFQYADHEIHITADVVVGMWHYYCATADYAFLANCLAPVALHCARYWIERIDYFPDNKQGHLLCVMGPDEYTHASDDNAYTNCLVSTALRIAADILETDTHVPAIEKLKAQENVNKREVNTWRSAAKTLCTPYDSDRSLVLQSADFELLLPVDFNTVWPDRTKLFGATVSQEKLYRMRVLKQADVLMLMQLFPTSFYEEEMRTAFEYYEPITTHDSSLSYTTHSIIATWINKPEVAWDFFVKARDLDTDPKAARAAQGIHSANAAALWQCIVFGFLGMLPAYLTDTFTLSPHLPKQWNELSISLTWRGVHIHARVTHTDITLIPESTIEIEINKQKYTCKESQETIIHYTK